MPKRVYKRIDAWRGYYSYESTDEEKKEGWRMIAECHFVPHAQNDEFVDTTRRVLKKNFHVRIKYGHTSNVFSTNVIVMAKPKDSWTKELENYVKRFEEAFVDYYTRGFSIFTGETSPIDLEEYEQTIQLKSKEKIKEVI